jgi:hypothetical protein
MENMENKISIKEIKKKQKILKNAGNELKKHFVGIDNIIDRIIKDIETWYIMPQLLSRPPIVCLWGLTGVGKTDLIRKLAKLLNMQDRFKETILSTNSRASYGSVASYLRGSGINTKCQNILLFDEIQNFRSLDQQGVELNNYAFQDFWTLLSDGKLPYQTDMSEMQRLLWDLKNYKSNKNQSDEDAPFWAGNSDFYDLELFKGMLRLPDALSEIAQWDVKKKEKIIIEKMNSKEVYEEDDYTQSLIFISGNLDEAYGFAKSVEEVDLDADILHNISKQINILNIKTSLKTRFRPEQISRFGNEHIIYPSLSKQSFNLLIDRKINETISRVASSNNIKVHVDQSIKELIYANGVYPAQGTRPLFSTISDVLENSLPNFIFKAILKGKEELYLEYRDGSIICLDKEKILIGKRAYKGSIDELKRKSRTNLNRRALTAVHEAGHAITYAILLKYSPIQIVASVASNDSYGFVFNNDLQISKDIANKLLAVKLAGKVAEEIVFHDDNISNGASADISQATFLASSMVREWGMNSVNSHVGVAGEEGVNTDLKGTDVMVERLMSQAYLDAKRVVQENIPFLMYVSDRLMAQDKITKEEFVDISKQYGVDIKIADEEDDILFWDYHNRFLEFKNEN